MQDWEGAQQDLQSAILLDWEDARALVGQGFLAMQRRDYSEAIAHFSSALDANPRDEASLLNRGPCR